MSSIFTKNKVKQAEISKLVLKVERKLRLWFLYQKIYTFQVFSNKSNVNRGYLEKEITRNIFHKKDSSHVKCKSKKQPYQKKYSKLLASKTWRG